MSGGSGGRHVVFFRDLNLGQVGSPSRVELVSAFAHAGALDPVSFQVNGTVIFSSRSPVRVIREVKAALVVVCGWDDVAPVRSAPWVMGVVGAAADVGERVEISFFDARQDFPASLPWRPDRGRVTVVQAGRRHAVAINDQPRTSHATPELERLLGIKVTSRGLPTMQRLARTLVAK